MNKKRRQKTISKLWARTSASSDKMVRQAIDAAVKDHSRDELESAMWALAEAWTHEETEDGRGWIFAAMGAVMGAIPMDSDEREGALAAYRSVSDSR